MALVVGLAALLLGGGLPLQAHPAATVLVCEDPACAICTNLLDDVCIHGVTVQDIRVDVLASNRLRVVHYIAADTQTTAALLQRWDWDGKPGLSDHERRVFEEHAIRTGPPVQLRSGELKAFFAAHRPSRAVRSAASRKAAAMHTRMTRFLFPDPAAIQVPGQRLASISFLDPKEQRLVFTFDTIYNLPEAHDFAVATTLLMSPTSHSTFTRGIDRDTSFAWLRRAAASPDGDDTLFARRLGIALDDP